MIRLKTAAILLTAFATMATSGLAQTHDAHTTGTAMSNSGPAGYHRDMMATMQKMDQGMKAHTMSGNPDRDFAAMMIPHHQGAIDMAKVQLQYGKDEKLRGMAKEIIAAQEKEIQQLKESLAKMGDETATTHSAHSM